MADGSDLYAVLGLSPSATQEQIRRAYRALMRQNHPDTRLPGDPAHGAAANTKLQQAVAAYGILGDPARRAAYDHRRAPTRITTTVRRAREAPGEPPIKASPVRWHHGPS